MRGRRPVPAPSRLLLRVRARCLSAARRHQLGPGVGAAALALPRPPGHASHPARGRHCQRHQARAIRAARTAEAQLRQLASPRVELATRPCGWAPVTAAYGGSRLALGSMAAASTQLWAAWTHRLPAKAEDASGSPSNSPGPPTAEETLEVALAEASAVASPDSSIPEPPVAPPLAPVLALTRPKLRSFRRRQRELPNEGAPKGYRG